MQGIELARRYYETFGAPMIHRAFPEQEGRIAAGIAGTGSECFGFDDALSRDHDYQAGFCLWLLPEDEEQIGFRLMRAYEKLPKEFEGVHLSAQSYYGSHKFGVHTIPDFLQSMIGMPHLPETWQEWFYLPAYAIANAVNGEIFRDDSGTWTAMRETLRSGMPEDVRKKKIAAHLALAAQSGQYNYGRCLAHGEQGAAALALAEYVNHMLQLLFLLNRCPCPYYKWSFRALTKLPVLSDLGPDLSALLIAGSDLTPEMKKDMIETACGRVVQELKRQELSRIEDRYLETQAFAVMETIGNRELRALHVMEYGG